MLEQLLKRKNQGSSLIFVIVAIAFIGILGTIIMQITLINVKMKVVDKEAKNSFYSAETGVNELQIVIENITADAMKEAYQEILLKYGKYAASKTVSIKDEFEKSYLEKVGKSLAGSTFSLSSLLTNYTYLVDEMDDKVTALFDGKDSTGKYDISISTKDKSKKTNRLVVNYDATDKDKERSIVLKDLKIISNGVSKSEADATQTVITTDMTIVVPNLAFEKTNIYPEFTKYAIIANRKFEAGNGARNLFIDGNVYAGDKGIDIASGGLNGLEQKNITIIGDRIITRGPINVRSNSGLKIGDSSSTGKLIDVWTEAYKTEQDGETTSKAFLDVYANSNVAGDLSLDANYSDVYFDGGNYYGYTFNKGNTDVTTDYNSGVNINASSSRLNGIYSSAILLNGTEASFQMKDMNKILLAGRAFVSRIKEDTPSGLTDILLGEAVSFKGMQTNYLVPNDMLITGQNPMSKDMYQQALKDISDGKEEALLQVDDTEKDQVEISKLLAGHQPYSVYTFSQAGFTDSGGTVYIYYNFKDQNAANTYTKRFYSHYKDELEKKIKSSAFVSSTGKGVTLTANELYSTANVITYDSGLLCEESVESDANTPAEEKLALAMNFSKEYKSRQLNLVDGEKNTYSNDPDDSNGFRLLDKEADQIFDKIIMKDSSYYVMEKEAKDANFASKGFTAYGNNYVKAVPVEVAGEKTMAYFVVCSASGSYNLEALLNHARSKNPGYTEEELSRGIIVTKGDFEVNRDFRGLVIASNMATMKRSGSKVTADPKLVQSILNTAHAYSDPATKFTHYFVAFNDKDIISSEDSISKVDFSETIFYSNWKKNEEN